ncbi:hypothetical protein GGI21_005359 [Coemansia aciculifera]|uniref:Uncharacterized protein n=1 Tax=Coemansia aciculifera TaxID=417176 RepID=A0ACC1M4P2_9FUNG|nr:hypothetical protein GGI21_005359 [Coemansia aciculifera]KAJ2895491.1 hypothetical protein IWW38_002292 [Coemansia aciculifera]
MSPIALDFAAPYSSQLSAPAGAGAATRVQDLLLRSPLYTDDCDLYPRRMREVMNQRSRVIVVPEEEHPGAALYFRQQEAAVARRQMTTEDIEALLKLYPGAARHLQI